MGSSDDQRGLDASGLPHGLMDGFARLCQGEFQFRLPRDRSRDPADTAAFFFNTIADELGRLVDTTRTHERRLRSAVDRFSEALLRVASGDLEARVERDMDGEELDVLAYLINNTVAELSELIGERQRHAEEDRERLETLVTERTQQLQASEENFRRMFEAAPVALVMSRLPGGEIVSANPRALRLFEVRPDELEGTRTLNFWGDLEDRNRILELLRADGAVSSFETRMRRASGELFWADISVAAISLEHGHAQGIMAGVHDISVRKEMEEQLRVMATIDPLTKINNRRHLFQLAGDELRRADRYERPLCFAMVDVDHFKSINDRFGHSVGDEALRRITRALEEELRGTDIIGRYGGEELAAILPETPLETAKQVCERLRASVRAIDLQHEGEPVSLAVSIGVVERTAGETVDHALSRADAALYEAKSTGRDRVVAG